MIRMLASTIGAAVFVLALGRAEAQQIAKDGSTNVQTPKAKSTSLSGGTVMGTITVKRMKLKTEGPKSEKDVVVYLEPVTKKDFPPSKEKVTIDQKRLTFVPHVVAVQKGATIEAMNSDSVVHNVHTVARRNQTVNVAMRRDEKVKFTLPRAEVVRVVCDIHPEMAAYIVVVDTPYFTVAEIDGKTQTAPYTIGNVPPGKYVLKIWNKNRKIEKFKMEVTVEKGKTAHVDIQLKKKSRRRRRR